MKYTLIVALAASLSVNSAHANMPPTTYDGPLPARVMAQINCTIASFDNFPSKIVLPDWFPGTHLRAGQYWDPTSCKLVTP